MEKQTNISFKEYRALAEANRKTGLFREPQIVRCKNGDWYIGYSFCHPDHPGKWKAFKERGGLNYIKNVAEKEKQAELLRTDVLNWLLAGNSPFDEPKLKKP